MHASATWLAVLHHRRRAGQKQNVAALAEELSLLPAFQCQSLQPQEEQHSRIWMLAVNEDAAAWLGHDQRWVGNIVV